MKTGDKIRYYRKKLGLTQSQLADIAHISRVAIGNYERGDRIPKIDIMIDISDALGVDLGELISESEFKEIAHKWSIDIQNEIKTDEKERQENDPILQLYRDTLEKYKSLNYEGQLKVNDYVSDLVQIFKYTKKEDE